MAILAFTNHISFRFFAFLANVLSVILIIVIFDRSYYFTELKVGFFIYLGGAITGLIAGIIYKNPKQPKKDILQTILDTQDKQTNISTDEKVMFLEYLEQEVKTLSFQEQKPEVHSFYLKAFNGLFFSSQSTIFLYNSEFLK